MGSIRSAAERLFRRAVALYPAEFRAEYGEEMALLLRDRGREEPLLRLMIEVFADTLKTAPREHLSMWIRDLRYAARMMRRSPGFTLVAAVSLAIGIGANAAIFSLVDALILRPIAVPRPGDVVSVRTRAQDSPVGAAYQSVSYPDYLDFRERSRSFEGLVASNLFTAAVARGADVSPG
jgi:hypothetical protein